MNSHSQETLRRIEQNDVTELCIGHSDFDGWFISSDAGDYSRLGAAIGNNIHLKTLNVYLGADQALDASNTEFFNGLKRNSSINDLSLNCRSQTLVGGVWHEILKVYLEKKNLTCICINNAVLDSGGGDVIAETLRWCRNLKTINFGYNNITDEQLLPIVEAIKGGCNASLENLVLDSNIRIGNAGCHVLATLLEDPHCSLQTLELYENQIGNEGATAIAISLSNNTKLQKLDLGLNQIGNEGATAIANSLSNNTNLKILDLNENPFDSSAVGIFCTVLCDTSSVNNTYRSNHTLEELHLSDEQKGQHADHIATLLDLNWNWGENKSHMAIRKILRYHPNIDMKPLFEWDLEGEQTLKSLPYAISWFGRAEEAVAGAEEREDYHIEQKKLSAIFQFAKAMPLLLVPASHIKVDDRKRKRGIL